MPAPLSMLMNVSAIALAGGPFVAGGAIPKGSVVTYNASGLIVVNGANGWPVGIVYETYATGDTVMIYQLMDACRGIASGTIAVGDNLTAAAAGQIASEAAAGTSRTANTIGVALEATTVGLPFRFQV